MVQITAINLAAGYRHGQPAIRNVSFTAKKGTITTVLGRNGGGKTTLLRAIAGLIPFRDGLITTAGTFAYMQQNPAIRADFPITVGEVVTIGAYGRTPWYRRISKEDKRRVLDELQGVGLDGYSERPFCELSGGQKQRVLLAQALLSDAAVLLLDEPFAGVDRGSTHQLESILFALRDHGHTMIVASHDVNWAKRSDNVLCLNDYQIAFGNPRNALTADVLKATYGSDLFVVDQETIVNIGHH